MLDHIRMLHDVTEQRDFERLVEHATGNSSNSQ